MRVFLAVALLGSLCSAETPPYDPRFDLDLFTRLAATPGNVACSPFSVRVALAMTYGGARGQTAREIARVLRQDAAVHGDTAELLRRLEVHNDDAECTVADALWTQAGEPLLPAYLDLLKRHYLASPQALDFATKPEEAADRINAWVEGRTRERIRRIVSPELFSPNTSLVLTNALHFRAAWQHPFQETGTKPLAFRLASGESVDVPTMQQVQTLPWAERESTRAVELPYAKGPFALVIVVPAGALDAEGLRALLDAMRPEPVSLYLPRFTFESAFRLDDTLKAMGMPTAFSGDADFSGMNGGTDLFISAVTHRAFVTVDEKGTEAAAATAVVMERKGKPAEPREFRADRPFLFCLRDRETGALLFLGRVSDPRS